MSDISDITTNVRYLVEDFSRSQIPGDIFTYTTSAVFTLTESNVISITSVLQNDSELGASEYSYDSNTGKITISASLTSGDTIEVRYTYFPNYSDTEIENFIRASAVHLSANRYCTFEIDSSKNFNPEPSDSEKNLIAFIASTLIKPDNISYRLPDITISVPQGMPTRDIVRKSIAVFKHNKHGHFSIN